MHPLMHIHSRFRHCESDELLLLLSVTSPVQVTRPGVPLVLDFKVEEAGINGHISVSRACNLSRSSPLSKPQSK